jgi:protease-4
MWRELRLLRDAHKPLIVSMGNVAASGGYYIAAPADVIVAEPGTITGSIGVLSGKFVTKDLFDKLGIGTDAVSDGRNAQIDSPLRPFSKEERAKMDEQMHATYDQFVARVAEGRRLKPEQVDAIGRGRVWTGHQAKERGLVDEIGGLDRAIDLAKAKAQIAPTSSVHLVVYPPRRTFFDLIGTPSDDSLSERLGLSLKSPELRAANRALRIAQLFRSGEVLTLLPTFLWN